MQSAFVLHARRYGETSLLVELLTGNDGRCAAIAKGFLRGRSPALSPFQLFAIELRGRGEVLSIAHAEPAGPANGLSGRGLYCGFYLNELLLRLTARQDACPGVFKAYAQALVALSGPDSMEIGLRRFEVSLLGHLGLGLQLDLDGRGVEINADQRYTYEIGRGAIPCAESNVDGLRGSTLLALRHGEFAAGPELLEARRLMRRVLDHYLDGRPLRSRELFR